ncbi:uridine 5'-monophosphate synthase isoform X2 [Plutella xylostella]|uniref:uridine 5'-monophosphate synthase isoform X2 n=1 Tax=Plutella xylostella TaxID=51655 RepID=UPI0020325003|nr:uridine 5'-monophosphate synthase isoform X2 [Plutella xylostella]
MGFDKKLENLAVKLFEINAVKFGEFVMKSGLTTPVYFDLRVIVSYPEVLDLISSLLYEFSVKSSSCDHLCGVPYTALPIATLLSVQAKKPMLMRRKEAKAYGTKKLIEGHFKAGQTVLIVEDVVTSGGSVLETVNDIRKEGLVAEEAVVIVDRQQGGVKNLEANNVHVKSLFTISSLLEIFVKHGKVTKETAEKVKEYLKNNQAVKEPTDAPVDRTKLTYEKREKLANNPIAKKLFNIMATKKSNLCLSVDLTSTSKILDLLTRVGEHICLVKTHVDIIEDFSESFVTQLKQLADRFGFLILEDRKFADIGNTVSLQYSKGLYKIGDWADCVTVHSLPGEGVLKAISASVNGVSKGVFLLAEMSSEGNLITPDYIEQTVKVAAKYPELMTGFVCQNKKTFSDPGLIQLTPGVQLQSSGDGLGQVYNTPEKIILENGADIAVVGRGIVAAKNPEAQVVIYRDALWKAYVERVGAK